MTVDEVVASIQLTVGKPFDERRLPFHHLLERLEPIESSSAFGPKLLWILLSPAAKLTAFGLALDPGVAAELRRRRKSPAFAQYRLDIVRAVIAGHSDLTSQRCFAYYVRRAQPSPAVFGQIVEGGPTVAILDATPGLACFYPYIER